MLGLLGNFLTLCGRFGGSSLLFGSHMLWIIRFNPQRPNSILIHLVESSLGKYSLSHPSILAPNELHVPWIVP